MSPRLHAGSQRLAWDSWDSSNSSTKGLSLHLCRTYKEPTEISHLSMHLQNSSADGCPLPNLTRVPLDGNKPRTIQRKGDLGNYRCHSQKGEVVVLADYRTANRVFLNAERSMIVYQDVWNLTNWLPSHLSKWRQKASRRKEEMEPETG